MSILLPLADGIAESVRRRLPAVEIVNYESHRREDRGDITFYCLPYMSRGEALEVIPALPRLQVVQSLSSGVDELVGLVPPGVTLCNGRGLHHEEGTAELAIGLIIAGLRRLRMLTEYQLKRQWNHLRTDTLEGKRVTIVGYGSIGAAIDQRLVAFGCQVQLVSRTPRDGVAGLDRLAEVAANTDVLIVCIALGEETMGLVDASVLAALPDGALVVNVARGPVVEARSLLAEVESGRLSACLDVTDPEPLPHERPEWDLPNVLLTPHIGGDTYEFARRAGDFVADQVTAHVAGQTLRNVVK